MQDINNKYHSCYAKISEYDNQPVTQNEYDNQPYNRYNKEQVHTNK